MIGFQELNHLVGRVNSHIENVVRLEQQHKDASPQKKELVNSMDHLTEVLNKYGIELKPINFSNKEKLLYLIKYLTEQSIPNAHLPYASLISRLFLKLIKPMLEIRDFALEDINLVPSSFFGKRQKQQPPFRIRKRDPEVYTPEQQVIKEKIHFYLIGKDKSILFPEEKAIINFLEGIQGIDQIGLTKQNARVYLNFVKIIDYTATEIRVTFKNSSYDLRTAILKLCSPGMTTNEAYTITLDSKKFKNRDYLKVPAHWVPERTRLHLKETEKLLVGATTLSRRLNHFKPTLWAVRGKTAVGKGHALTQDSYFHKALDEKGQITGTLDPDPIKYNLQKENYTDRKTFIVTNQSHSEGIAVYNNCKDDLLRNARNSSLVIQGRLSTIEEMEMNLFSPAKERDCDILLLDLESSFTTTINRILARDPFTEPCPPLPELIKGNKESYQYRPIRVVRTNRRIKFYKLYITDSQGKSHLIAEKLGGVFKTFSPKALEASCEVPSDQCLEKQLNKEITSQYIEDAIQRGDIRETSKHLLEHWKGVSLAKAVEMHVTGNPVELSLCLLREETAWRSKYGKIEQRAFTGTWLQDYPQIIDHLHSEHLLHIKGCDEDGKGLHWQTNKFDLKLNPKFNPETSVPDASQGGFEMKLGYFIVPLSKVDKYTSLSLSKNVLRDLEVSNASGEVIGYRFFVHPEAYYHFKSLHESLLFIQPEDSEYLGTPTSSYRSWVIRRVKTEEDHYVYQQDSVPFIVKFGVASSPENTSRLLSKADIVRSIQTQIKFDEMDREAFHKGAKGSDLMIFPENLGLVLKDIPNYPPSICGLESESYDSGMIVREFPQEFLKGECKIINFSALMSLERLKKENQGLCSLGEKGMEALPLIYEVIHAAIPKDAGRRTEKFIDTYLIKSYLEAIEDVVFKNGMTLSVHGQNLCFVLKSDNTPRGFAYRDLEGVFTDGNNFIKSYSWWLRYHIKAKLLNVLTTGSFLERISYKGAPLQVGLETPVEERNLYRYLTKKIESDKQLNVKNQEILEELGISSIVSISALGMMDQRYRSLLAHYFDLRKVPNFISNGHLLAAEPSSSGDHQLSQLESLLWKNKRINKEKGETE